MTAEFLDLPMPTIQYMVDAVFDTVATNAKRSQESIRYERQAATAALVALQPTDAIEADMAVLIVSAHHGALDNLRRAALPDVGDALAIRLRANANSLSRMAERMTVALQERQAMGRAARQVAALEAALNAPYGPDSASEENCRKDPMPSENAPTPQGAPASAKAYRIRLEQLKAEKQAARAARMAEMAHGDVSGMGATMAG